MLADPLNELVFRMGGGRDLYLVGGNLRDIILNRQSTDRDFVVSADPRQLAEIVASHTGGKTIILGGERLYRIILPDRSTIDFSALKGDIVADLRQRDFTINSIGWSLQEGIIDPTNALPDLRRRVLRMTSRENLINDPVRILRAYRFAAEIDFTIERKTRRALREFSPLIATEKPERITLEFFRIINVKEPERILTTMLEDGVLERIILQSYAELCSILKVISSFEKILDVLPLQYKFKLNSNISQNLTYSGLLRLESLFDVDSALRLKMSSVITRKLLLLEKANAFKKRADKEGAALGEILFDLFEILNDAAEDFLIIKGIYDLLPAYRKYLQVKQKALLSTEEICQLTGLHEGESLGKMIRALKKAEFYNEINDKDEAREYLCRIQGKM